MSNWPQILQGVKGGLNVTAGAIRTSHLNSLAEEVRDRERDLKDAITEQADTLAAFETTSSSANDLAFKKACAKVDVATLDHLKAQRILDRAQSQQALYQVMDGAFDLGGAMMGNGMMGGGGGDAAAMLLPAAAAGAAAYVGAGAGRRRSSSDE